MRALWSRVPDVRDWTVVDWERCRAARRFGYECRMRLGPILLAGLVMAGCGDERRVDPDRAATPPRAEKAESNRDPAGAQVSTENTKADRAPAATPSGDGSADAELRTLFDNHYDALDARDWEALCRTVAPEVTIQARNWLRDQGNPNPPRACPEVFALYYGDDELFEEVFGEMADTARLDSVDVKGQTAYLNWRYYEDDGTLRTDTQQARKVGSEWRLLD